ncbi:MAG TPA: hypothetical protein PLA65_11170 [Spirochaetota bacterium]|nr:hypothetical protein [Spirochaetota bacterium]HPG50936.1 hypothetical protein [Spirochaetota bacterium]HPN12616.1 hypothetical protein [Spirochaetota bacterium]
MKKILIFSAAFSLTLCIIATVAFGESDYNVYCAEGKIAADSRTLDQMKSARGSDTCLLKSFSYSSDADTFAESVGGKGASCSCN